jgi:6-phosphogluconolactonase (cycloisomerase 2 family)
MSPIDPNAGKWGIMPARWVPALAAAVVLLLAGCRAGPAQQPPPENTPRLLFALSGEAIVTYAVNVTELPHGPTWRPSGDKGDLRPIRYTVPKEGAREILPDPGSRLAFVLTRDFGLSIFRFDAQNGALALLAEDVPLGGPTTTGAKPFAIALDPSGRYLVVGFVRGNGPLPKTMWIKSYEITPETGELTYRAAATSGISVIDVKFDPTGRYLYASSLTSSDVRAYAFDPQKGTLQPVGSPQPVTGSGDLAVDPGGPYLYAAERGTTLAGQRIVVFKRQADGSLTRVSDTAVPGGPRQLTIHPSGGYLYVSTFVVPNTGALGGPLQTLPMQSEGVSIDRAGEFMYVPGRFLRVMEIDPAKGTLAEVSTVRSITGSFFTALSYGSRPVQFQPRYMFVTNRQLGGVAGYAVNLLNGAPEPINSSASVPQPTAIASDPNGRNLYVTSAANSLTSFRVESDGKLTSLGTATLAPFTTPSLEPTSMAVDPSGRFLFIALRLTTDLVIADRDPDTGAITIKPSSYVTLGFGCRPSRVTIDPAGRFTYVSCVNGGMVLLRTQPLGSPKVDGTFADAKETVATDTAGKYFYSLDKKNNWVSSYLLEVSGQVFKLSSTRGTGSEPVSVAVDPLGRFLYTANRTDKTITMLPIRDDGLDVGTTIPAPAGTTPAAIQVDPSGQWLYLLPEQGGAVSRFSINQQTGDLSFAGSSPAGPAGSNGGDLLLTQSIW